MDRGKHPESKILITTTALFFVILFAVSPLIGYAAVAQNPLNWQSTNGNSPVNWNYSPQTAINTNNVKSLVPQWIFSVPAAPPPFVGAEGSNVTPLVVNGIAYIITSYHRVISLDAGTGKLLWFKDLPLLANVTDKSSIVFAAEGTVGHYHNGNFFYTSNIGGTPMIWVFASDYRVYGLNALTGDIIQIFSTIKPSETKPGVIPGNYGLYDVFTTNQVVDYQNSIVIGASSSGEGTDAGRGFFQAYDMASNPPKLLWRTFEIPPQDGSNQNWSLQSVQNMSHAWIFAQDHAVDLKALPADQLSSVLVGDWGNFHFNGTRSWGGNGGGWGGSWALDTDTGTAYVATNQPSPYTNATFRPGPNLWSSSILSIDEKTGRINWGFQSSPHDVWDWDCSWSVMLATVSIGGTPTKVVYKACKNGILFALDAATGKLLWFFKGPAINYSACTFGLNGKPLHDPLNKDDMTKNNWPCWPSGKLNAAHPQVISSPGNTGAIESDIAFDPNTGTVFVGTFNHAVAYGVVKVGPGSPWQGNRGRTATANYGTDNSTIYAVDASTGQVKWSYFIPGVGYRGGLITSGGVLYAVTADGTMHMLDVKTGAVIAKNQIGGPLIIPPAIAADTKGNYHVILPSSGGFGGVGGGAVPGYVVAFGLPAAAATTSVTTSVSTSTVVSTQTVAGTSTGIDPTTFYGVVAVAVVFVIATGALVIRRRTPAS